MRSIFVVAAAAAIAGAAQADIVQVQVVSQVDGRYANTFFNNGPLGAVVMGNTVTMTFTVDSNVYVDSVISPYRGYAINPASFTMTMGSVTTHMQFPTTGTPMFCLGNNDPAIDRFFISTDENFQTDVYLDAFGQFDSYSTSFGLVYDNAISSLDILGALGTYDWTGLNYPSWTVNDGFATRLEMYSFDHMTISAVPVPGTVGALAPAMLLLARRRRRTA